jgi:hypothetical protein
LLKNSLQAVLSIFWEIKHLGEAFTFHDVSSRFWLEFDTHQSALHV